MKKLCSVVLAAVTIIGLMSGPAAAATAETGPPSTSGWLCQKLHICP